LKKMPLRLETGLERKLGLMTSAEFADFCGKGVPEESSMDVLV